MKRLSLVLALLALLLLGALPASAGVGDVNGRIVFERNRPPVTEIWTMSQDGSEQRLFSVGEDPDWSPDGTQIVFARGRYLLIMRADASGERRVPIALDQTAPREPDWSPDGAQIAFAAGGGIYVVNAAGGTARLLAEPGFGGAPAWSPDGSKIVFLAGGAIWVVNADGSGRRALPGARIPSYSGAFRTAAWSPDGSMIAYGDSSGGVSTVRLDGAEPVQVVPSVGNYSGDPTWSPDGTRIAFVNGTDICAVNADGSGLGRLTYAPVDASEDTLLHQNAGPDWQPLPRGSAPAGPPTGRLGPDRSWNRTHGWSFACSRQLTGGTLKATAAPRRARAGSIVTYRIHLENRSRAPMGELVYFGASLDGGMRFLSASATQGRCGWRGHLDRGSPEYHVECYFGSLFPGERATATLRIRAKTPGELVVRASLPESASDVPETGDGSAPADVQIRTRVLGCTRLGTQSPDLLSGSHGVDVLCGLDGDDRLRPGRGRDLVSAGRGADKVDSRDGYVDEVICGSGLDSVVADRFDRVGRHCESVVRR